MRRLLAVALAVIVLLATPAITSSLTTPDDPFYSREWALTATRTNLAWDTTRGAPSVVIAVIDRGVNLTHPELVGKLVPGYNFWDGNATPGETLDDSGHGSATGGIVGAATNNANEIATYCWDCRLMPLRAWGSGGYSSVYVDDAIVWATDHGADIISISVCAGSTSAIASAVQYATSRGVLFVAAQSGSTCYPAAYPEAIVPVGRYLDGALAGTITSNTVAGVPFCNWTLNRDGYGTHEFCAASATAPALASILGLGEALYPDATRSQVVAALRAASPSARMIDVPAFLAALGDTPAATVTPTPTATPTPKPTFCDRHPGHRRC